MSPYLVAYSASLHFRSASAAEGLNLGFTGLVEVFFRDAMFFAGFSAAITSGEGIWCSWGRKKLGNPLPGGGFVHKRITNALGGQSVKINGSGVLGQVDQ